MTDPAVSTEAITDLWPEDLQIVEPLTPVAILKQQAILLGKKTKNLVEGRVYTVTVAANEGSLMALTAFNKSIASDSAHLMLVHNFDLVISTLGSYKYTLFTASHDINLYPVYVSSDQKIKCENEEEFMQAIKRIFASEETRRVISSLIAQSKS